MRNSVQASRRSRRVPLRTGVLFLALLLAAITVRDATASGWCLQETSLPETVEGDASCVTWIVEGMMKSKSGAT